MKMGKTAQLYLDNRQEPDDSDYRYQEWLNNQIEIWKPVIGYEDLYEVSSHGRIKSLSRFIEKDNGTIQRFKEKILKLQSDAYGYKVVALTKDKKATNKKFHRIIAEAFIPNPDNLPEINHKNGIKSDNRIENLEWCTRRHNLIHALENGLSYRKGGIGEKNSHAKLNDIDVINIRNAYKSLRIEMANKYGVSIGTIESIIKNTTWRNLNNIMNRYNGK